MINDPDRLRAIRKLHGYTEMQVADYLGIRTAKRIENWENGLRLPGLQHLLMLCALYHVTIDTLFPELQKKAAKEVSMRKKKVDAQEKRIGRVLKKVGYSAQ
jgi:transcriptional regulator with XRE-family HTH domain